jgi:hypothetical protein
MFKFFMEAKRGGICSVGEINFSNVYKKGITEYILEGTKPPQVTPKVVPDRVIVCLDANSLYPFSMTFPLPTGKYNWLPPEYSEMLLYKPDYDPLRDNTGVYLEVDIECPQELHHYFSRYPLLPEHYNGKLVATLFPKKNYKVHMAYLRWAISMGYRVTKIHRGIIFEQKPVFKDYINYLVNERKKYLKGTFLNEFYKIFANSLFGKTCENPLKYRKFEFAIGDKQINKKLNHCPVRIIHVIDKINEDVILLELQHMKVWYHKPLPIGCAILDISNFHMKSLFYNFLVPKYNNNLRFLYTGTDSLVIEVPNTFHNDIKEEPLKYIIEQPETKGVLGLFKLEKDNIL